MNDILTEKLIDLDEIDFSEQAVLNNWGRILPRKLAEVYMPLSCIEKTESRIRYLAEHVITGKKAVVIFARGQQKDTLCAEADVMDILVLDCIPRKIAFTEGENTAVLIRDYLYGESINGSVIRNGCFDEEEARELGKELCELVSKLYERHLTVDTSSLKAENIILSPEENMKFVEPEGISYCADVTQNWAATGCAIGKILTFMVAGKSMSIPAGKISAEFAKVLERSTGATSERYESVEDFRQALEASNPAFVKRKRLAKGMIALTAALALIVIILTLSTKIGHNLANKNANPPVDIEATEAPGP